MKFDWLIVGAGFSGSTLAERIANKLGQKVLLVERRDHIGGNAYDEYNECDIQVHRYGPHIFHTNSKKVWDYLSQFTGWRPYYHHVLAVVDGKKIPVPFNLNSLAALFPRGYAARVEKLLIDNYGHGNKIPILKLRESSVRDICFLAEYVYEKIFYGYTLKQWELQPEDLDPSVTARVPFSISRDDRYFQDIYQAIPAHGYTDMFQKMLAHPNIKTLLSTDYREIISEVNFERMIYTGPVDEYFNSRYGTLPYRSQLFDFITLAQETYQEAGTINYPNEYDFTRITEMKYLSGQANPNNTTLIIEYPKAYCSGQNEPLYPIPQRERLAIYNSYVKEAAKLAGKVFFCGRLAEYRYYNMDQVVERALKLFEEDIFPYAART